MTAGQILIGNETDPITQTQKILWDADTNKFSIDGTSDTTNILISGSNINTGGGEGTTYTAGTGLSLTGTEFSSTITHYTDASLNLALETKAGNNMTWNAQTDTFDVTTYTSLNLALATKAGNNMTWNAETNTFNDTRVSSGGSSAIELSAANEGTNITIDDDGINRRINVGKLLLPYTAFQKFADKFIVKPFQEPVTTVPKVDIVGTDYEYLLFTNDGQDQTPYHVTFPEETECDILIVGGGGTGGCSFSTSTGAGGGGGGQVVLIEDFQTGDNTSYNITVGKGGKGDLNEYYIVTGQGSGNIGFDSIFNTTTAREGGGGGIRNIEGSGTYAGGGGGGFGGAAGDGTAYEGGSGCTGNPGRGGRGGAGADGNGGNFNGNNGENGGVGLDRVGSFIFSEKFGTNLGYYENGTTWFGGGRGGTGEGTASSLGTNGVGRHSGTSGNSTNSISQDATWGGGSGGSIGETLDTDVDGDGVFDRKAVEGGPGVVIIRYKVNAPLMIPYTPSGFSEYKDSNWVVNNYPPLSDFEGTIPDSKITSTPTIPTTLSQLSGTIPYSSITGTPSAGAAATFSSIHPFDTYNQTSDGQKRECYVNNGTTYYAAPGDNPFVWEDSNRAELMRFEKNVTLGIGLNPDFRLHVAPGPDSAPSGGYTYF